MEPKMTQEHYDQIVEQHNNGAVLRLRLTDTDISTYCKPKDDINKFIDKCKFIDALNISFSVSSGSLVENEEDQENDTSSKSSNSKSEKDLNEVTDLLKILAEIIEDEENNNKDKAEKENNTEDPAQKMLTLISDSLEKNNNRILSSTIDSILDMDETIINYHRLTPSMRVCVIILPTGHEVIGVAQVLNAKNDVKAIGNKIAYNDAKEKLWEVVGSIAKIFMAMS